jgi:hypothetical protein
MQKKLLKFTPRFIFSLLPLVICSSPVMANKMNLVQKPVWDFGVQALYLKSSYTDGLAYGDDTRIAENTDKRNPLHLDWGWGFKAEGSYHFCNNDVNLNWYHYRKSSNGSFVFRTNPTADTYTLTPQWDAVNLEFGQTIHVDTDKTLRLHGGLQYAQIKTTYHGSGTDPIAGPGVENDSMKYDGIGPRIGADMTVGILRPGLYAYFAGDAAMLVGKSQFTFNETFGETFAISGSRPTAVVPEVGLKIGAKYEYDMTCHGKLIFDAGYMVVNYFNALSLTDNFNDSESNFALNGWYLGLKWMG